VHDLRVAARRLIAALDLLAAVIPERQVSKVRLQLKRLLKTMNPLRDTQVQLLAVKKLLPQFPELEPYCTVLLMRELRSLKQIARRLVKLQPPALRVQVREGARTLDHLSRTPETRDAANLALRGAFASAFARVATMRNQIIRTDPRSIHRMRVSFKKFRYVTEIVRPEMEGRLHKAMNAYQTRMGDVHDTEVLIAGIRSFTREYPAPDSLLRVQRHLRRQLAMKVAALMKSMNEFREFYDAHSTN
jgi:CHAD domain-containing protein